MKTSTTLVLVLAAVVLGVAAVFAVPPEVEPEVFNDQGELFFPELVDPFAAREIEVFEPDPETATVKVFAVKNEKGLWRIPSHHGYPADATERMANAATSLIGLKKEKLVSASIEDRSLCGVEDPLDDGASSDGRGKRIRLKDGAGRTLADVIVGRQPEGKHDWAFLREPGSKQIYAACLKPPEKSGRPQAEGDNTEMLSRISTRFSDWIDTDLLRLEREKIAKIALFNYSIDEEKGSISEEEEITLTRAEDDKWRMENLNEEESLIKEPSVRDIVSTLDNLLIAGVRPTPDPLFRPDMRQKGFFVDQNDSILGNEGHMQVLCDDGVVYCLYFGEVLYGSGATVTAGSEKKEGESGEEEERGSTENRYLFVRVAVDPELEKMPQDLVEAEEEGENTENAGEDTEDAGEDTEDAEKIAAAEEKEAERERKRKEWQSRLDAARERVDELRVRFAKWYYVIGGSSFDKLRKSREDLIEPVLPDTSEIGEQPPHPRPPIRKPSGLAFIDLDHGTGKAAVDGDQVKVLYTGWLKDGTGFDKADDRTAPFSFTLGKGAVIAGWDEGIVGMRIGSKRKLIIPPELGYGAEGKGEIPPDATLIFDVELIEAGGD
jgi:hypothetical protein